MAHTGGDTVKLRDARTGRLLRVLKKPGQSLLLPAALAFSPDGTSVLAGTGYGIAIWNVQLGAFVRELKNHIGAVTAVAFSSDGKLMASGSADHTMLIWDTRTWAVVRSIGQQYEQRQNPFS